MGSTAINFMEQLKCNLDFMEVCVLYICILLDCEGKKNSKLLLDRDRNTTLNTTIKCNLEKRKGNH